MESKTCHNIVQIFFNIAVFCLFVFSLLTIEKRVNTLNYMSMDLYISSFGSAGFCFISF